MAIDPHNPILVKLFAEADAVEAELSSITQAIATALQQRQMAEVGRLLFKAKQHIAHGEWREWIAGLGIPYQDANQAMRLWKQNSSLARRVVQRAAAE